MERTNLQPNQELNKCILYVEDDLDIASVLENLFNRLGYDITIASRASEALKLIEATPVRFDLVITDFNLMNINGLELSKRISKINADIPVIVCTGSGELTFENMRDAGVCALLLKPFSVQDLEHVIHTVLDNG